MQQTDTPSTGTLADRGIGWQATGFSVTGLASLAILKTLDGSDYWLYQWFETATVDLYWAFVLPLAVLFDGGRKLFEKGKAIREAKKARIEKRALEKGRREGEEEERERILKELEAAGVTLPPVVADAVLRKRPKDDSQPSP